MSKITFGTSGYRGIINQSFTLKHVQAIGLAIAQYLLKTNSTPKVVIGFDPRQGNDPIISNSSFIAILVQTLQSHPIQIDCCPWPTPTPVIAWAITQFKLTGGIMLTASHNPPNYNGLKLNQSNGAPAELAITNAISKAASAYFHDLPTQRPLTNLPIHNHGYEEKFADHLFQLLLRLIPSISSINSTIAIDVKHGACGRTWHAIENQFPKLNMILLHEKPLADFGGQHPNPTAIEHLNQLKNVITDTHALLGIANDPDGDRHMILDESGQPVSPEETTAIIAHYCIQAKLPLTTLMTTLASSQLIQKIATTHDMTYIETPIGFKYFTPHLARLKNNNELGLAVESSGGMTISSHTLEKCGFLPGLLIAAICHDTGQSVSQLRQLIYDTYGQFYFSESALDQSVPSLPTDMTTLQPFFSTPIQAIITDDGLKLVFANDQWVLARQSGTEPVVRIYAESTHPNNTIVLIDAMKRLLNTN